MGTFLQELTVGATVASLLELHVERWGGCMGCELHVGRSRVVLGRGTVPCDVLFVGEAPGESEDAVGRPFVGPAGKLLDQMVERSGMSSLRLAFTNLVCCIPRTVEGGKAGEPEREHVKACQDRLAEFVEIASPRLIVTVGNLARDWLDPKHRGSLELPGGVETVTITHPAAMLRANEAQRDTMVRRVEVVLRNALEGLR